MCDIGLGTDAAIGVGATPGKPRKDSQEIPAENVRSGTESTHALH